MSIPFTNPHTPPTGKTWRTMLDEIALAYYERIYVVDGSEPYLIHTGQDVQSSETEVYWIGWKASQEWLEASCVSYINHVSGPLNVGSMDFLYFTLTTWRSAAGLNVSGFRRSIDGVNFSYGKMQAGDVIGPWIFEDLQKGFSALKWNVRESYGLNGYNIDSQWYTEVTAAAALAGAEAYYNYLIPGSLISNVLPFQSCSSVMTDVGGGVQYYYAALRRSYGEVGLDAGYENPRSADLYFLCIDAHVYSQSGYSESYVFDLFGDFAATKDELSLVQSFGESSGTLSYSFGDTEKPTWASFGGPPSISTRGYKVTRAAFLCKWNFTNQG